MCHGRLKFTVVSEPMDDNEECVDVGHAFLNLQELLLTGNDVIEQQLDSAWGFFEQCLLIGYAEKSVHLDAEFSVGETFRQL